MAKKQVPSALPVLGVGIVWVLYAMLFPLHRPLHMILAAAASAAGYLVLKKVAPPKTIEVPDEPIVLSKSGDAAADKLIAEGQVYVNQIREANVQILDEGISKALDQIESRVLGVFDALAKQPGKHAQLRRFMQYYLPTTLKLANTYHQMDAALDNEESRQVCARIQNALEMVAKAFERQLNSLYSSEMMDISTDIDVLESMLKRDGLE